MSILRLLVPSMHCPHLKKDGVLSIAKHNRIGRVMQMAVLLDDFEKANALLDGENSTSSKFGSIRYYESVFVDLLLNLMIEWIILCRTILEDFGALVW